MTRRNGVGRRALPMAASSSQTGEATVGPPSGARAQRGWFGSMAQVRRWEQSLEASSQAEVTLLEHTLATVAVGRPGKPGRPRKRSDGLMADRGYDRNPLRACLARRGMDPILPARRNHTRATHQDGRKLRRYRRRGSSSGPSPGWATFGVSSSAMNGSSRPMRVSARSPVPSSRDGGFCNDL